MLIVSFSPKSAPAGKEDLKIPPNQYFCSAPKETQTNEENQSRNQKVHCVAHFGVIESGQNSLREV
jgi:hypothetical protein